MTSTNGSQFLAPDELETGRDEWKQTIPGISGVSPDGRWLGIYRPYSGTLFVYRLPALEQVAKLTHPTAISDFEFSPLGDELAIGSSIALEMWSTTTWERTRLLKNPARKLIYAPNARTLWLMSDLSNGGLLMRAPSSRCCCFPPA